MTATGAWFPDFVARWYDDFLKEHHQPFVAKVRHNQPSEVRAAVGSFLDDPHGHAEALDAKIAASTGIAQSERRYRALQAASDAIDRAGIVEVRDAPGDAWDAIRLHWRVTGSLATPAKGLLLPRRSRRFAWLPRRPERRSHEAASHFHGFVRPRSPDPREIEQVATRVMADLVGRVPRWRRELTIAVAPLVERTDELRFDSLDAPSGERRFRVVPRDPSALAARAARCLEEAMAVSVDVLLFPELCLTPDGQSALAEAIRRVGHRAEAPWLVIAGSAHTPREHEPTEFHNRALVFDHAGEELLRHNKLYPYEISQGEQTRYGLAEALGEIPRTEDIVAVPRRLEVLETALGRVAVLICEDLSQVNRLSAFMDEIEIDWLFVPVMDGVQAPGRWTATYAAHYARQGTAVLVGTCGALIDPHRAAEREAGRPDPGEGVGLLAHPNERGAPRVMARVPGGLSVIKIRK